jgi:protocatechuate 3,4-dioxygenase beta subunit
MKSNRRDFLKKGSLGVLAAALVPFKVKAENNSVCDPTTEDISGPFFLEGAPETNSLIDEDYSGERFYLTGRVTATDCETGLANAVLDFWHADESGAYDEEGFTFRGKVITDAEGNYNLETIIPGKYLNGANYRPSHIHLRVQSEGYTELITQIYFKGDVDIEGDHWASNPSAINRIIPVSQDSEDNWSGTFDVVLSANEPVGVNELQKEYGDLSQNYPNPFNTTTRLFLVLNKNTHILIEIFDQKGGLIKVLMNQKLEKGRYELNWNTVSLNDGVYTAVWHSDAKLIKSIKMIKQNH